MIEAQQQAAVGIQDEIGAAGRRRIVDAIPNFLAHAKRFAVERRPNFRVRRLAAEFRDDLVPQRTFHRPFRPDQLLVRAMNALLIAP